MEKEPLLPKYGGYRKLKSFQLARLVYDITVRFCDHYISIRSRTHDQMVQAARSGVQNIAEGSEASGTSRKFEIKLTNVARASLEELKLDYEDYLRQRGLPLLEPQDPILVRFKMRKIQTMDAFRNWLKDEIALNTDQHRRSSTYKSGCASKSVGESPCKPLSTPCFVANAVLSLLNLTCYLLYKQVTRLANDFEKHGGFTERMYRVRSSKRKR
jgi:four helix bundle suffix protein